MEVDLKEIFNRVNERCFDGFLDLPAMRWNSRLRSSAGRFVPGSRRPCSRFGPERSPVIEVASYLLEEQRSAELVEDTIAHEMIHYWLWVRRRPYGHTPEFYSKMRAMGVSRYNTVPRRRPFRYLYGCAHCEKDFPARKKLSALACASCCRAHAGGRYDPRFKLVLRRELV